MGQIYIIHENDDWTAPLEQQLEALGQPFVSWHLGRGRLELGAPPPFVAPGYRAAGGPHTGPSC